MSARNRQKRKNGKVAALVTVVLLLIAFAVMGTIAWLTATDEVTNTFTVGKFNKPDIDPENPDPDIPEPEPGAPEVPNENLDLDGYIVEPSWDTKAVHKLIPGVSFFKDPYVGIGPDSESAVVYVYIDNPYSNKVYFTLNDGWSAVEGKTTAGYAGSGTYSEGLFRYNSILTATSDNAWTSAPVFDSITVSEEADEKDLTVTEEEKDAITVSCFIHQAYDENGDAIDAATIQNAAIAGLVPEP